MPSVDEQQFWEANYWDAVLNRDVRMDGIFYYGVLSTGVYCRPCCHSRLPKRENVVFFQKRELAERAGFRACLRCRPEAITQADPQVEMIENVCRFIEKHLDENVTLAALGKELGLSPFHVQRTFKDLLGITPKAYRDSCRLRLLKGRLQRGQPVTSAMYDAGYSGSSRLYERAHLQLGMTPGAYRKAGAGMQIRYSIMNSAIGKLLVAATRRGICSVQFSDTGDGLLDQLRKEFHAAEIREEAPGEWAAALLGLAEGHPVSGSLPLDIRATAFQRQVWQQLQLIAPGRTQSYAQVAKSIGHPKAARAVARACATNPVALAIPCHRVIRSDGAQGGYRWGLERKKALLAIERGL